MAVNPAPPGVRLFMVVETFKGGGARPVYRRL